MLRDCTTANGIFVNKLTTTTHFAGAEGGAR